MLRVRIWMIFLVILMISCQVEYEKKQVIGCYRSWDWQQYPELFNPQNIPYDKLTMIYYCFFYPLESGEIVGMDPVADRYLLKGETDSKSGSSVPVGSITATRTSVSAKLLATERLV